MTVPEPLPPVSIPYVRLLWNVGTVGEWQALWRTLPRSTLTQSFGYAQALARCERVTPRLGLIEADDRPVGLVQVLERRVLGVLRVASVDRGPLWLTLPVDPPLVAAGFAALRRAYPPGLLRWTRLLPELPGDEASAALLRTAGFRQAGPGYRTIWLDLSPPEAELRRRLDQKWRNRLNAADRAGLTVEVDSEARALPWLTEAYLQDRARRRYRGPSGPLVIRLRNAFHQTDGVWLLRALAGEEPVAGVFVIRHGTSATYLVGWSGDAGRRCHAHGLLLWRAILTLKAAGVAWFDLGGIDPAGAPGLTRFKRGLGGEEWAGPGTFG